MSTYSFIDVTEAPTAVGLSAESVKYNGVWLEEVVPGFRTLQVEGRELLGAEVEGYTVGDSMGEYFRAKHYQPREIIVRFQLIADTNAGFRSAFNALNSYLRPEQAQLIFNDETDKYFIATSASVGQPDPGVNAVIGEISFRCSDPRKYAVTPKEFTAVANSDGILEADIANAGTVPVPIDYEITNNNENGFIGIAGPTGAIQLGYPDEVDGETYTAMEQLLSIDNVFSAATDSGTNYMRTDFINGGTMGRYDMSESSSFLWLTSKPGTADKWNGAIKTITLSETAANFYCYFRSWFQAATVKQLGLQTIAFLTADNQLICGYSIFKTKQNTWDSTLKFYAKGNVIKTIDESAGASNNSFRYDTGGGSMDIRKVDDKITFHWRGTYPSYIVPEVENMSCAKIQIGLYGWSNTNTLLTRNYLQAFNFFKINTDAWDDVPNRYSAGDVVEIDGNAATVSVNGMLRTSDEVVGSSYFKADPGTTPVLFTASDWAQSGTLTAKATIREAWI